MRPHLRVFLLRHLSGRPEDAHGYGCHASRARHLVGCARGRQEKREIRRRETERRRSLHARSARLVESPRRHGGIRRMSLPGSFPPSFTGEEDREEVEGAANAQKGGGGTS